MAQLYTLVYSSTLCATPELKGVDMAELIEQIRARSAVKNQKREISGVLLYNAETQALIQVLEGDERQVRSLFDVICLDPRHKDIVVLNETNIDKRKYEQWGMLRGSNQDWKQLKMFMPSAIPGTTVGTFDAAFQREEEAMRARTGASRPASPQPPQPHCGLRALLRMCLPKAASVASDPSQRQSPTSSPPEGVASIV